jgi:hypothetical protein
MKPQISLTTICAVLAVFGAGTLQIAIALAMIHDIGIRAAFMVAILAAIIMDALVIHAIGTSPSNWIQKGLAIALLVSLFIGLALDVIVLLTADAFSNETFGFLRAFVGVNIAVTLVLACGYFAASDTHTHEREIKKMRDEVARQQMRAFLESPNAAQLFSQVASAQILADVSKQMDVPIYTLTANGEYVTTDPVLSGTLRASGNESSNPTNTKRAAPKIAGNGHLQHAPNA